MSCLDKANEAGYAIIPIMFDGASTHVKTVKKLLKEIRSINAEYSNTMPELKLETYFLHDGKKYFVLFCMVHTIKNIRNALVRVKNEFVCPKLTLPTGCILQSGTCSVKWIRDSHHKNKNKIISNMRINRNIECVSTT